MTLAERIVVLNRGRIQQIGEPQSIYARPANRMVATFLGNPPMNILPATFTERGFQVGGQFLPCPAAIRDQLHISDGQNFDLGIRPEHIEIVSQEARRELGDLPLIPDLKVEVRLVEPLGRETLIRANLPESVHLNIQTTLDLRLRPGDRLSLQLDLNQLFVFAPDTGNTLYP